MSVGIYRAKNSDYGEIISLYSASIEAMPEDKRPNKEEQAAFFSLLEKEPAGEAIYVAKERNKILGFIHISHSVSSSLFPKTNSYAKTDDLLYALSFGMEEVLSLKGVYIEPRHQNNGLGSELLKSVFARYKEASWITALDEGSEATHFFLHRGFSFYGPIETELPGKPKDILYRKYRPSGLCREAFW